VAATAALSGQPCDAVNGARLILSYADVTLPPPVPAVCIMPQGAPGLQPIIPGLEVVPDFLSGAEEAALLSGACGEGSERWREGISRRVQVCMGGVGVCATS
jgi:hypothetical protein